MDPGGGSVTNSSGSNGNGPTANVNFPGAHPSSEGKRRRNRSNVEAMTAKHLQDDENKDDLNNHGKKWKKKDFYMKFLILGAPHNRFAIKEKDRIWWIGRK